jgi:hypothetical protein
MFGNGSGESPQPQDTKSLWGDMFGLGSLMKVITDPALVSHAHGMMQATIDGAHANRRIEAKLDRLLQALGHEINDINSRFPAQFHPRDMPGGTTPALLVQDGPHGTGGHPAATGAADDGSRGASGSVATPVGGLELRRDDDPTGGL